MNQELLRLVDSIARDRNIDSETVFEDLESAMISAIRKANAQAGDIAVRIDRDNGEISAAVDGSALSMSELGRIAAQTAKQVMIQKIREAERGSIYEEYLQRKGEILTGRVVRREGGALIVESGRAEAIMPRSEQIPGETHSLEDRIRAMILEVREQPGQVRIVLSRTHPDFVRRLFEVEVPEVSEGIIEIRALAREAGYRTKVAVSSLESRVDAVGACVGIRGSRIRSIVDELGGEKIDIVRWDDSSKVLIANALKPAEVYDISLCFELGRAIVVVTDDQLSLAIGKRGQNVRLAARLTQWDIDILTPVEFNGALDILEKTLLEIEEVDSQIVSQIVALGMVNVLDLEEVGPAPLVKELELDESLAGRIVQQCSEQAVRISKAKDQARRREASDGQADEEADTAPAGRADLPEKQQKAVEDSESADQDEPSDRLETDGDSDAALAAVTEPATTQVGQTVNDTKPKTDNNQLEDKGALEVSDQDDGQADMSTDK